MGSALSSLWPFGAAENQDQPPANLPLPTPRRNTSPRLTRHKEAYSIQASLRAFRHPYGSPQPILYLNTGSVAVAEYCLLGRLSWLPERTGSLNLDPESAEHLEICLRMRRCGAVKLTPEDYCPEIDCQIAAQDHLDTCRYLFGWPPPESTPTSTEPVQPVWVYSLPYQSNLSMYEAIPRLGMEVQLKLAELTTCTTMVEYCEKLDARGATYHSNVLDCAAAREMGLIRPATKLEDA